MDDSKKVVVVRGGLGGLRKEICLTFVRKGFTTIDIMRNLKKSSSLKELSESENLDLDSLELDVIIEDSDKTAISNIAQRRGKIDI